MGRVGVRMTRRRWSLVGGVALVVLVGAVLVAARPKSPEAVTTPPSGSPSPTLAATTAPSPSPATDPTAPPTPEVTSGPTTTPSPTASPEPTPQPTATDPPEADGDPRLLYAEFLLRVNDDRASVDALNAALSDAAQAQDTAAVSRASVDILDFVDAERDWLREHPPAACYGTAHKGARSMIAAYGDAAERFFDWSGTGGGLAGLEALGTAIDAAETAGDALAAFRPALETTTCPG
jgi:outer membrane biosynthesis protein TonB